MKKLALQAAVYLATGLLLGLILWFVRGQRDLWWSPIVSGIFMALGMAGGLALRRRFVKPPRPNPADEF